ncbi:uncharacterized protein LOC144937792 [Lampetra fluviatilis]
MGAVGTKPRAPKSRDTRRRRDDVRPRISAPLAFLSSLPVSAEATPLQPTSPGSGGTPPSCGPCARPLSTPEPSSTTRDDFDGDGAYDGDGDDDDCDDDDCDDDDDDDDDDEEDSGGGPRSLLGDLLSSTERIPDAMWTRVFALLRARDLCACARVCSRWHRLAWQPALWCHVALDGTVPNADQALEAIAANLRGADGEGFAPADSAPLRTRGRAVVPAAPLSEAAVAARGAGRRASSHDAYGAVIRAWPDETRRGGQGGELSPNWSSATLGGFYRNSAHTLTMPRKSTGVRRNFSHGDFSCCGDSRFNNKSNAATGLTTATTNTITTAAFATASATLQSRRRRVNHGDSLSLSSPPEHRGWDCWTRGSSDRWLPRVSAHLGDEEAWNDTAAWSARQELALSGPRVLVLSGCASLTDAGLRTVASRCSDLRRLEVSGCGGITEEGLREVVLQCRSLHHLDASDCPCVCGLGLHTRADHMALRALPAVSCGASLSLRRLDLSGCSSLEAAALRSLAVHCPNLTHLYVRRCPALGDGALRALARGCPRLRAISFSDCPLPSDLGLREVAAALGARLAYLGAAHCSRITDGGVRHLGQRCPALRYVNVRGCEAVTDAGVGSLARGCLALAALDVGSCPRVSDLALVTLAARQPGLRCVGLRGCGAVSGAGLRALADGCPQLRRLSVQGCDEATAESLRYVRRRCPACVIEHTNPDFES